MQTGPYKEGTSTSEFYGSMTGGLSPVLASALIFFMTKLGVQPSEATQMVMYIGAFVVALPSIVYYIKKRLEYKSTLVTENKVELPQVTIETLLASPEGKKKILEALLKAGI